MSVFRKGPGWLAPAYSDREPPTEEPNDDKIRNDRPFDSF